MSQLYSILIIISIKFVINCNSIQNTTYHLLLGSQDRTWDCIFFLLYPFSCSLRLLSSSKSSLEILRTSCVLPKRISEAQNLYHKDIRVHFSGILTFLISVSLYIYIIYYKYLFSPEFSEKLLGTHMEDPTHYYPASLHRPLTHTHYMEDIHTRRSIENENSYT